MLTAPVRAIGDKVERWARDMMAAGIPVDAAAQTFYEVAKTHNADGTPGFVYYAAAVLRRFAEDGRKADAAAVNPAPVARGRARNGADALERGVAVGLSSFDLVHGTANGNGEH